MLDEPIDLSEELTVKQVVETMLKFQAILVHWENDTIGSKTNGFATIRESHGVTP
eukprot:COSAG02_NODE_380_length_23483_cov_8.034382_1_plen_54_part_10